MTFTPLTAREQRRLEEARNSMAIGYMFVGWVAEELQVLMLREYLTRPDILTSPRSRSHRTAAA